MNKIILMTSVAILFLGAANESQAEVNPNCNCSGRCECFCNDGTNCCMCYIEEQSCGSNCSWSVENGVLKITGSGTMNDFNIIYYSGTADDPDMVAKKPWDEYRESITAVEIDGISNIGKQAFDSFTNLKSVTLGESVKTIGFQAFFDTGIESIDLSNVERLEEYAFESTHLKHAVMPDNISIDGEDPFYNTPISDCGKSGSCGTCDGFLKSGTGCVSDCGTGYVEKDGICTKQVSCTNGASIGGECFPKRYTPAEIAKLVGDSNTILLYYK